MKHKVDQLLEKHIKLDALLNNKTNPIATEMLKMDIAHLIIELQAAENHSPKCYSCGSHALFDQVYYWECKDCKATTEKEIKRNFQDTQHRRVKELVEEYITGKMKFLEFTAKYQNIMGEADEVA